jgi:hypothetical protein
MNIWYNMDHVENTMSNTSSAVAYLLLQEGVYLATN